RSSSWGSPPASGRSGTGSSARRRTSTERRRGPPVSDTQLFFAVLLGLYLLECATLVGRQAVVISSAWGARFRAVHPSGLVGSDRLGLVLGNPLPPLGTAFVTQAWPFSVAPSGWFSYSALSVHP